MSFSKTLAALAATGASLVLLAGCGGSTTTPTRPVGLPGAGGLPGGGSGNNGGGNVNPASLKACEVVDASTAGDLAGTTFTAATADAGPTCEYISAGHAVVAELQPYPNEQLAEAGIQAALSAQASKGGSSDTQTQEVSIGSKGLMEVASDGHSVVIVFAKDSVLGILSVSNDTGSVDASKVQSAAKSMADKV